MRVSEQKIQNKKKTDEDDKNDDVKEYFGTAKRSSLSFARKKQGRYDLVSKVK